jgi:hypothetical protein
MKKDFLKSEMWLLTVGGAFQHAKIYKQQSVEKERAAFRNELRREVISISSTYESKVSENDHLKNITRITQIENSTLNNGHLNFGIGQKALNLYLKYLWCLGEIPTPPHFPVDRIIQQLLQFYPIISWTHINNSREYMLIIDHAKKQAERENCSLAELELKMFKRNNL